MTIGKLTPPLLIAFQRLMDLISTPQDIPILAPVIHREIVYRLLVEEQGERLRQMATAGTGSHRIAQAIEWLRSHFSQPFSVDQLARQAGMSNSTFHHHFRSITALIPLQYQKKLRLQEARTLMLADRLDAATAAFRVGYESPSQFSREYRRMFGAPPLRDIAQLRELSAGQRA